MITLSRDDKAHLMSLCMVAFLYAFWRIAFHETDEDITHLFLGAILYNQIRARLENMDAVSDIARAALDV